MRQAAHAGTIIEGTQKIELSSVECTKCHLSASLDENKLCAFCRRPVADVDAQARQVGMRAALMLVLIVAGAFAFVWAVVNGAVK